MTMRHAAFATIALLLTITAGAAAQDSSATSFAQALTDQTNDVGNIVELYVAKQLGFFVPEQTFIAAVNAQRTDQQTTASSSAPASVSNVEKNGIADILALAIERGKVTETKSADSATLSTTPYAVATFVGLSDTPANWKKYKYARRLS